ARAAEGDDLRVPQLEGGHAREEFHVLGVGARIAGFDVADAELVEPAHDLELVLDRERDALGLRAVAEGGIVGENLFHAPDLGATMGTARNDSSKNIVRSRRPGTLHASAPLFYLKKPFYPSGRGIAAPSSDRDHDLADLLVGFHVAMRLDDLIERKG